MTFPITHAIKNRSLPVILLMGTALLFIQCKDSIINDNIQPEKMSAADADGRINQNFTGESSGSSSIYAFNAPEGWNDLVVYAHGYVDPQEELAVPDDEIDGVAVADIVAQLGMAYATTSYPHNGLNGPEAVADIVNLVNEFVARFGQPEFIYLVGVSEGALVTTLAVELHSDIFSGGLAPCGPIGNFRRQINYFGDFHVLFNYFFPGIRVGSPAGVEKPIINAWRNGDLKNKIASAVARHPDRANTLLDVARVPVEDPDNTGELQNTFLEILRFNVLATNDAIKRLGGRPFDNSGRYYSGTGSVLRDRKLNRSVERFSADRTALRTIHDEFQTTGNLSRPLVTMHTSGDQVIPYWHEPLYSFKVFRQGASLFHSNIPIIGRFGHCNFTLPELLTGFSLMVYKVKLQDLLVPATIFSDPVQEREFMRLSRKEGIAPVVGKEPTASF